MKEKNEDDFAALVRRLEKGVGARDSFGSLCREIGADERKLDAVVRETLGIEADKLVKCYKFDIPLPYL